MKPVRTRIESERLCGTNRVSRIARLFCFIFTESAQITQRAWQQNANASQSRQVHSGRHDRQRHDTPANAMYHASGNASGNATNSGQWPQTVATSDRATYPVGMLQHRLARRCKPQNDASQCLLLIIECGSGNLAVTSILDCWPGRKAFLRISTRLDPSSSGQRSDRRSLPQGAGGCL